jgi:hypothetical protein
MSRPSSPEPGGDAIIFGGFFLLVAAGSGAYIVSQAWGTVSLSDVIRFTAYALGGIAILVAACRVIVGLLIGDYTSSRRKERKAEKAEAKVKKAWTRHWRQVGRKRSAVWKAMNKVEEKKADLARVEAADPDSSS